MAFVKWKRFGFAFSVGILFLSLTSCLLVNPGPQFASPKELDEDFNKEPFEISLSIYSHKAFITVRAPYGAVLKYRARSYSGDTRSTREVRFTVGSEDTASVLWSNRSGDTLRTLVRIDRSWFDDPIVVDQERIRIRRPPGTVECFIVHLPAKALTFPEGEEILDVITDSPEAAENMSFISLQSLGGDTIALNPIQYISSTTYVWVNSSK